ncbi:hypothetical protein HIM_06108 [Hirsutella minnesotensis 3608]|uniref:Uncharacterized protein n=1 Tax=Hirsutella minnesotensis 3608 TaxID=1043627 RepID=A0A0F7ZZN1_9HYPO|nr:hypothetical protein HIM_06108 [Hirsutella minnesotensis 3608]
MADGRTLSPRVADTTSQQPAVPTVCCPALASRRRKKSRLSNGTCEWDSCIFATPEARPTRAAATWAGVGEISQTTPETLPYVDETSQAQGLRFLGPRPDYEGRLVPHLLTHAPASPAAPITHQANRQLMAEALHDQTRLGACLSPLLATTIHATRGRAAEQVALRCYSPT